MTPSIAVSSIKAFKILEANVFDPRQIPPRESSGNKNYQIPLNILTLPEAFGENSLMSLLFKVLTQKFPLHREKKTVSD